MKKIVFNGCSFMAGDELVWDNYSKEVGNKLSWEWFTTVSSKQHTNENRDTWNEYHNVYKRKYNLPHVVSELVGIDTDNKIDLSNEGKSNDMISLSTVNYILSIPIEDRHNYHVVIGWSSIARAMKFIKKSKGFINLNPNQLGKNDFVLDYEDYIKVVLINADEVDLYINYIKNILLLENFLRLNGISYTFYRALGSSNDFTKQSLSFNSGIFVDTLRLVESLDAKCWVNFTPTEDIHPSVGESWTSALLEVTGQNPKFWVSPKNAHPNLDSVKSFATIIAHKIKEDKCLD
jgi:hypothetical protein